MPVDLRSDTVTLPTEKMLSTMVEAQVGDDGRTCSDGRTEDPTVRRLEDKSADITGKSAALFVPSGTFGNMLATLAVSDSSQPIWVYDRAHIVQSEKALFDDELFSRESHGYKDLLDVPAMPPYVGALLLIEDTVSSDAGRPLSSTELDWVDRLHRSGWRVHMDGARLFNAVVATGISAADIARPCDTVTFCLSKGLGAPVGSVLCGDAATIARARTLRKRLGGAMRQAGYVAAAGLVALEEPNIERLADDHRRATLLRESLGSIDGVTTECETNIIAIHFERPIANQVVELLSQRGYLVRALSNTEIRVLTHRGMTDEHARLAGEAIADCTAAAVKQQ